MHTVIVLGIAVAALFAAVVVLRGRGAPRSTAMRGITLQEIPRVFAALSSTGKDGTFAVFVFGADGEPPARMDALNVQFSIEGGRIGIDWVLLAPLNLESQSRFVAFFEGKSRPPLQREANQVKYLRVEGEHLAEMLQEFLGTEFKVRSDQKMDLISEGFVLAG